MPGLGRRTFAPGEVLTATNVMGYLQDQAVMNFAGTAARGSAIGTAVSEGMVSYIADADMNGAVQVYDGSAWNFIGARGSTGVPFLMAAGTATVQITSGYSYGFFGTTTVTLPSSRFGHQPIITCTINSGAIGAANVNLSGTTSFTAICHGHVSTANVPFMYTAVQMLSTGSTG